MQTGSHGCWSGWRKLIRAMGREDKAFYHQFQFFFWWEILLAKINIFVKLMGSGNDRKWIGNKVTQKERNQKWEKKTAEKQSFCMPVCICLYMFVCMYFIYLYVCTYVYLNVARFCVCMCVYLYVCVYVTLNVHVYILGCFDVCIFI